MRNRGLCVLLCCLLPVSQALGKGATNKEAIAVLDVAGTGMDAGLLESFTEMVSAEVDASGHYRVISGRDIQTMIGFEKQKEILGCSDAVCLSEIGGALGVDRLIATQIGTLKDTYIINMKLINIRSSNVEARTSDTVHGDAELLGGLRRATAKLLKSPPANQAPSDAPLSVATAAPSESRGLAPGAIGLASAGVAVLIAGGVLGFFAKRDETCANQAGCIGGEVATVRAPKEALAANIAYGAGGLLAAGGLVWILMGTAFAPPSAAPATAWAPVLTPHMVGWSCAGRF